jgi:hypothetical protein
MRNPASHIIRKTAVNFDFTGNFNGLSLRQEISGWTRTVLVPAIETALSEYDLNGEVISIDNISLDFSFESSTDWKSGFQEVIVRQIRQKIGDKMFVPSKDVSIRPATQSFADLIRYYLELGFLPWNSFLKNAEDFKNELNNWIEIASSSEIKKAILGLTDEKALDRLTVLVNPENFEILISVFSGNSREKVRLIFREIESVINQLPEEIITRKSMAEAFQRIYLQASVVSYPVSALFEIIAEWLDFIVIENFVDVALIHTGNITDPEIVSIIRKLQKEILSGTLKVKDEKRQKPPAPESRKVRKTGKALSRLEKDIQEGIFIQNAGAVIIASFLPELFSRTGISKGKEITESSQALSLLNYCISGKRTAFEFELVLPAILCGITPGKITGMVTVNDEEMIREADEMLASVIEHWSVLKNTTVEGLREAFLQRNGKLVYAEEEWRLTVEQKPYDMLLEQLPWNISMISLPWMNEVLRILWI